MSDNESDHDSNNHESLNSNEEDVDDDSSYEYEFSDVVKPSGTTGRVESVGSSTSGGEVLGD